MKTVESIVVIGKEASDKVVSKYVHISYMQSKDPRETDKHPEEGSIWINTSYNPPKIYRFTKDKDWEEVSVLDTNLVFGLVAPDDPYDGLLWYKQDENILYIYLNDKWIPISAYGLAYISNEEPQNAKVGSLWFNPENKKMYIKTNEDSWTPVSGGAQHHQQQQIKYKGDEKTIHIDQNNTISVIFNNDETKQPGYVWDNKRIQKEALIKAIIFG